MADWDGIYLGRRKGGNLVYAGKVDHGFDKASAAELRKRLTPLIRKTQPFAKKIAHKGMWVEPQLLAEIEYRAKSAEGKVRHPFFKGLREDWKPISNKPPSGSDLTVQGTRIAAISGASFSLLSSSAGSLA